MWFRNIQHIVANNKINTSRPLGESGQYRTRVARDVTVLYTSPTAVALSHVFYALEFIQNKPTPPYTYGLGKVGTASVFPLFRRLRHVFFHRALVRHEIFGE